MPSVWLSSSLTHPSLNHEALSRWFSLDLNRLRGFFIKCKMVIRLFSSIAQLVVGHFASLRVLVSLVSYNQIIWFAVDIYWWWFCMTDVKCVCVCVFQNYYRFRWPAVKFVLWLQSLVNKRTKERMNKREMWRVRVNNVHQRYTCKPIRVPHQSDHTYVYMQ